MRISAAQPIQAPAARVQRPGVVASRPSGRWEEDRVELSPEALAGTSASETVEDDVESTQGADTDTDTHTEELTPEEEQVVAELKRRDAEVRTHEQAHASTGGEHAGSPQYEFQTGPDGQKYAVGGEVSISVSPVEGDPEATIRKMQTVRAAALAPAEPSAQDRAVAAQATRVQLEAQAQKAEEADAARSEDDASQGVSDATESEQPDEATDVDGLGAESSSSPRSRAAEGAYARAAQTDASTGPHPQPISLLA